MENPASSIPLIRWAGSKRSIIKTLAERVPATYGKYIEPFAGSACLFFHLAPSCALLGDMNGDLVDTYKEIKKNPVQLWSSVTNIPKNSGVYYAVRDLKPESLDRSSRAVRFLYLNRLCFNGIYRTNKAGGFNVPMGSKTGPFPGLAQFCHGAKLLKRAELINADFEGTLEQAKRGDFVYLDPPYADRKRTDRNEYGEGSFSPLDIDRLMLALSKANKRGVQFLLSYSDSPDFRDALPRKIKGRRISVRRRIASDFKMRKPAFELLLSNVDLF